MEQIYEALIYSDKYKSIFGEKEITDYREKLGISSVDDYKKTFPVKTRGEDALVDMRNDIYRDVSEKIAGQPLSDHVYLLNTPT